MTEIAQLFESALRQNRASLLRKAAINTVARMSPTTTLQELLLSDAGEAIRELSLNELRQALADAGFGPQTGANGAPPESSNSDEWGEESREERLFRQIMEAMDCESLTIGQLSKRVDIEVDELRGYLNWMKKIGKIVSSGRARATRYQVVAD